MERFDETNFYALCNELALGDASLQEIIKTYGYPPVWTRPNTFATLALTILEQQVSLASAYAAFKKLKEKTGVVTPQSLLLLTDEELRACYFSRQKIIYTRGLATAILTKEISLKKFYHQSDDAVRAELKKLKGIGDWTVDIYLIHALRRLDVFPTGDLALVNAIKAVKALPLATTKEELSMLSAPWKPYRTIATMLFWHYYIQKRKLKIYGY